MKNIFILAGTLVPPSANQRLDLWHANSYLRAAATELHGTAAPVARPWVKPLPRQIRNDQVAEVITQLEDLKPRLTQAAAATADKTIDAAPVRRHLNIRSVTTAEPANHGNSAIKASAKIFMPSASGWLIELRKSVE